jgi:hypothetical protein
MLDFITLVFGDRWKLVIPKLLHKIFQTGFSFESGVWIAYIMIIQYTLPIRNKSDLWQSCCHCLAANADRNGRKNVWTEIRVRRLLTLNLFEVPPLQRTYSNRRPSVARLQADMSTLHDQFLFGRSSATVVLSVYTTFEMYHFGANGPQRTEPWADRSDPRLGFTDPSPKIRIVLIHSFWPRSQLVSVYQSVCESHPGLPVHRSHGSFVQQFPFNDRFLYRSHTGLVQIQN